MCDEMMYNLYTTFVILKKWPKIPSKKILSHNTLYILPYHWFARLFIFAMFLAQAAAASLKAFN